MVLQEVCEFIIDCPHSTAPDEGAGFPIIRTPNIGKGRLKLENVQRVSKEVFDKRNKRAIPQVDDIIFAREAPAGNAAIICERQTVCLGQRTVLIRPDKDKVYPQFLVYYILAPQQQYELLGAANGATVAHINIPIIKKLPVKLPSMDQQVKIANIISTYDDLIENNQKQIKLLEEAAQRLYKEWFVDLRFPGHEGVAIVDGVPKGWEKVAINDIAEYLNGYAFKPNDWCEQGKPIIKIKEMNEGVTANTPRNDGSTIHSKYNVTAGDILFSWSATLTAMIWDSEDGLLNQHLFKVIPKDGICREYVLQSILKTLDEFKNLTTGSTMKHIQRGKLKEVFVNLPTQDIMARLAFIVEPCRKRILALKKQNILLVEARDRLLPKLMNGEIEV